jgi:hypothetical protein
MARNTIHTKLPPDKAAALVRRYLVPMGGIVMKDTVLAFRRGVNVKGKKLHVPKRLKGGGGSDLGLKAIIAASKTGARGLGGPGIDTGKLIAELAAGKWFMLSSNSILLDPSISVTLSYYTAYRDKYAGGAISGLNPKMFKKMIRMLKQALTRGS